MDITSSDQVRGKDLEKTRTVDIDEVEPIVQDWTAEEERRAKLKYVK